jgi:hypothetical protein
VVVQARVLIIRKSHAVFGAGGARQKSSRRAAVQVVNNIVAICTQLARDAGARGFTLARDRNYPINQI